MTVVPPSGGVPAATLIVPRRGKGPIPRLDSAAGRALSLQYAGSSATRELDAISGFDRAGNLDEFRDATTLWDVGSQNWTYADRAGQRHQALPYEILPIMEMPHLVDPPAGFIVNGNNHPVGATLDNDPLNQRRPGGGIRYLNNQYDGLRAGRITRLLERRLNRGTLGVADMRRIQGEVGLIDAEVLAPHLISAFDRAERAGHPTLRALRGMADVPEAIRRIRGWDYTTPTGV